MARSACRDLPPELARDLGAGGAPHTLVPADGIERGVQRADAVGHAAQVGEGKHLNGKRGKLKRTSPAFAGQGRTKPEDIEQ